MDALALDRENPLGRIMIILGVDCEATGLDNEAQIVELGLVVMNTSNKMILSMRSDLYKTTTWSAEAEAIHHIDKASTELGLDKSVNPWPLVAHYKPTVIVAHNAEYDKRLIVAAWPEFGTLPWICTHRDLPHDKFINRVSSNKLQHLAVDYELEAGRKHRALFDALLCAEIAAKHDLEYILSIVNEERFCVVAWFEGKPDFNDRDFQLQKEYLKKAGFRWSGDNWMKSGVPESLVGKYVALATVKNGWKTRTMPVNNQN